MTDRHDASTRRTTAMKRLHIALFSIATVVALATASRAQQATNIGAPVNSEGFCETAPTITSDGRLLVFSSDREKPYHWKLYYSTSEGAGVWSEPQPVSDLNDVDKDNDFVGGPFITYDDKMMYYSSAQDGGEGDVDIWIAKRRGKTWKDPENLGAPINTAAYEGFPSLSADGNSLYFLRSSAYQTGMNKGRCYEIWVSQRRPDDSWGEPQKLPSPVNSGCEGAARIMPDNKTLVFSSARSGGKGGMDLYLSKLGDDGSWSEPENITALNTSVNDDMLHLLVNLETLFYASGVGNLDDIYSGTVPEALKMREDVTQVSYAVSIQIMAFSIELLAERVVNEYSNMLNTPIKIVKHDNLFKLRTNLYNSYAEAVMFLDEFKDKGFFDAFIVEDPKKVVMNLSLLERLSDNFVVEIGVFDDRSLAESFSGGMSSAIGMGFRVLEIGGKYRVRTAQSYKYPDAERVLQTIRLEGYRDAVVVGEFQDYQEATPSDRGGRESRSRRDRETPPTRDDDTERRTPSRRDDARETMQVDTKDDDEPRRPPSSREGTRDTMEIDRDKDDDAPRRPPSSREGTRDTMEIDKSDDDSDKTKRKPYTRRRPVRR
jgi:Tol biopolymer transport system component